MPTLSAVMIVKNEEACLEDCLKSIRPICDEILIGDTGSTDASKSIAEGYAAWVFDVPWTNDFAAARNAVNERAHGDWLLHMDADEVVDPEAAAQLRAIVDADGEGADAVEVVLANYCRDARSWRWAPARPNDPYARDFPGYLPGPLLRLYRNRPDFHYREAVHENITESVTEAGGVIKPTKILIHHYGYEENPDAGRGKSRYYFELAQEKARKLPGSFKAWYDLAEAAWACREDRECERACRQTLELAPRHYGASLCLSRLLLNEERVGEAEELMQALLAAGQATVAVRLNMAVIAGCRGDEDGALEQLRMAVKCPGNRVPAHLGLCRHLERRGDLAGAEAQIRAIEKISPGLSNYLAELREAMDARREGERLFIEGDPVGALRRFSRALQLDGANPVVHNNLGVAFAAAGQLDHARTSLERALKLAPGYEEARANLRDLDAVTPR